MSTALESLIANGPADEVEKAQRYYDDNPRLAPPCPKDGVTVYEMRDLFLRQAFSALTSDNVWRQILRSIVYGNPKEKRDMVQLLLQVLPASEPEKQQAPPVAITIVNQIPRPPESPAIDISPKGTKALP